MCVVVTMPNNIAAGREERREREAVKENKSLCHHTGTLTHLHSKLQKSKKKVQKEERKGMEGNALRYHGSV